MQLLQCISGWLSRRDKKWELSLFLQGTTAEWNLLEMSTAVVTCTNKDSSHFLSLLDKQPEIHCMHMVRTLTTQILLINYFQKIKATLSAHISTKHLLLQVSHNNSSSQTQVCGVKSLEIGS